MKYLIIILSLTVAQLQCSQVSKRIEPVMNLEKAVQECDLEWVEHYLNENIFACNRPLANHAYTLASNKEIATFITSATALMMYGMLYAIYYHYAPRIFSFKYDMGMICLMLYVGFLYIRSQRGSINRLKKIHTLLKSRAIDWERAMLFGKGGE